MGNNERFYEPQNPEGLLANHLEIWKLASSSCIGPVNTNFKKDNTNIKLIVICESPSYAEVSAGFPTVCSTGIRMYNALVRSKFISQNPNLPEKYCFHTHYNEFEANGIYITNLIRFQADYGIKGGDETSNKDRRVQEAWLLNKSELFNELKKIKSCSTPNVLIACGDAFEKIVLEVVKELNCLGLSWFITVHPSKHKKVFDLTYNPNEWKNIRSRCSLHKKIEKKMKSDIT